jgi:hypothetical protein
MAVGIAATAVLMVVGPGSTAAMAGRLIGSPAIKNNSVRSLDIRNGTVRGVDVRDGSLTAADFSGTMRGATGPAGKTGPRGPVGTGGGPDSIAAWNVHHELDSSNPNTIVVTSSDNVPAGTQIEAVKLTITGDFGACDYGGLQVRTGSGQILASSTWTSSEGWSPAILPGGGFIASDSSAITLTAWCASGAGSQHPVPDFDASVTLAFTERSTTATTTFN